MKNDNVFVKWYKSAIISSGDTIRVISDWYHQAIFQNILINMNSDEIDDYNTCDGMCFNKVIFNIWLKGLSVTVNMYSNYFYLFKIGTNALYY